MKYKDVTNDKHSFFCNIMIVLLNELKFRIKVPTLVIIKTIILTLDTKYSVI